MTPARCGRSARMGRGTHAVPGSVARSRPPSTPIGRRARGRCRTAADIGSVASSSPSRRGSSTAACRRAGCRSCSPRAVAARPSSTCCGGRATGPSRSRQLKWRCVNTWAWSDWTPCSRPQHRSPCPRYGRCQIESQQSPQSQQSQQSPSRTIRARGPGGERPGWWRATCGGWTSGERPCRIARRPAARHPRRPGHGDARCPNGSPSTPRQHAAPGGAAPDQGAAGHISDVRSSSERPPCPDEPSRWPQ